MYFPKGFELGKAVQLAELVGQAYDQLAAFRAGRKWTIQAGYSLVAELHYPAVSVAVPGGPRSAFDRELRELVRSRIQRDQGLPLGFIACGRLDLFIVFRGTMTAGEWIRDIKIRMAAYPHGRMGRVHEGFLSTYELVRKTVVDSLSARRGGRLYVTGHSLGAALATLAAPDIAAQPAGKAPICYTFASPRVGDREFAREYNRITAGRSFRIANTSDMVVSVPFAVPFLGVLGGYFTHVDTPVDFTVQLEDAEKNHDISTYLQALTEARPQGFLGLGRRRQGSPS